MVESVLEDVSEGQVEYLHIFLDTIPSTVSAALLSRAVTKAERCQTFGGQLGQLEPILRAVIDGQDIILRALWLMEALEPLLPQSLDILARAAVKLQHWLFCTRDFGDEYIH